jgi:hypothetical protein
VHGFLHRALAPQTLASAWLVLTVALTLAMAVAQSAIAASSSMGPSARPLVAPVLVAGEVGAAPTRARERATAPCRALASADRAAPSHRGCAPGPTMLFTAIATDRHAALASLFGTAGPHGPPAGDAEPTTPAIPAFMGDAQPSFTLDFSLSHALRGPFGTAVAASSAPRDVRPVVVRRD